MSRIAKVIKITKRALTVLWWAATILLAFVLVGIIGSKLKGEVPQFFGYSVLQIVSGSMEDTIPTGTYILVKKVDASEIKKDDIICFYSDDQAIRGFPNTHRVVKDPIQGENGLEFVTQGDANSEADDVTAKADRLIGRHVKNMDGLTQFTKALEGNGMFMILVPLMLACMVLVVLPMFIRAKQEETKDASSNDDNR
ncbi:MAG: signal peptidase I [Clostridia bacterium]|nr:signal peptidase I [Clostridia bacterium]